MSLNSWWKILEIIFLRLNKGSEKNLIYKKKQKKMK